MARSDRRGMTIVELIIAVVLLSIGMLGLSGISLAVSRQYRGAGDQDLAAMVVQSRFDSLASVSCATLAPYGSTVTGTTTTRTVRERWAIADGNDVKIITDTVRLRGRVRPLVYESIIPCRD